MNSLAGLWRTFGEWYTKEYFNKEGFSETREAFEVRLA